VRNVRLASLLLILLIHSSACVGLSRRPSGPASHRLAILTGNHGVEYEPIVALHSLPAKIDPAAVRGTIVIVHIANPPAFQRRTIFYRSAKRRSRFDLIRRRTIGATPRKMRRPFNERSSSTHHRQNAVADGEEGRIAPLAHPSR
jgi:hypothetical protein